MRLHLPPRPPGCLFSEELADWAVAWINQHCRHVKGRWYGEGFRLRPWQEEPIREIFGRVDEEGNRQIRLTYWEVPKKNGKSPLAAAVALLLLFGDEEPGAEVYSAAYDRDQASIVFDVAKEMLQLDPSMLKAAGGRRSIIDSRKRIVYEDYSSFYRVVSAQVSGKHGFNSHGVIFDEMHTQRDMRLWEALTFGAGAARLQPLTFGITTAGIPGESPVAEMLHEEADQILRGIVPCPPSFLPVLYSADLKDQWDSEEVWRESNPAYGDFLDSQSVREECERAKRHWEEQNSFRRLRLNQWVKQEMRVIDMEAWNRCSKPVNLSDLKHLTWYAGLDLSTKLDVMALVLAARDGNDVYHVLPFFWLPKENLKSGSNQEARYGHWAKQGLIHLISGKVNDFSIVRKQINALRDSGLRIRQIAYDPWNAHEMAEQLKANGYETVEISQTFKQLSEPLKELISSVVNGKLKHGGHDVLRWMMDCLASKQDANGNIKPVKPNRMTSTRRIDGAVALIMAIARAMLPDAGPSIYESVTTAVV